MGNFIFALFWPSTVLGAMRASRRNQGACHGRARRCKVATWHQRSCAIVSSVCFSSHGKWPRSRFPSGWRGQILANAGGSSGNICRAQAASNPRSAVGRRNPHRRNHKCLAQSFRHLRLPMSRSTASGCCWAMKSCCFRLSNSRGFAGPPLSKYPMSNGRRQNISTGPIWI